MTKYEPVLRARTLPVGHPLNHERVPMYVAAVGGLHYIRGNHAPYFTVTLDEHRSGHPDHLSRGGAAHERILALWPELAELVALHLSDIDGVPMHAEANGWYWLAGALGGAGQTFHGGNADRQHWGPAGPDGEPTWNGYRVSTPTECLQTLADHLRITLDEARKLADEALDERANNPDDPDGWAAARAAFALRLDDMRPRWKAEADACIERYGLRVYGDPWTEPDPIGDAAEGDPGELNEPPLHPAAELTGGRVPAHYAGAYPRLSCCGGPVALVPA